MTSRSGQWSRWRRPAPPPPPAIARHIAIRASAPIDFTVFTEVWTINGERNSSAAASTASMVRSLTTLMAATPYRSAKARATISPVGRRASGTSFDAMSRTALAFLSSTMRTSTIPALRTPRIDSGFSSPETTATTTVPDLSQVGLWTAR